MEKRAEPLKQVAASYGASYDTFFRAYKEGRIRVIRFGRRLFVPSDEIERLSREGIGPARRMEDPGRVTTGRAK
jgi:predicted site-specific integrase-resolvase